MRLTRFQSILVATALAAVLIVGLCRGATCLILLSLLLTLAGLWIGLGVSFPQWQMFGPSRCRVRTGAKVVALTFDDGPDPQATPALLTLLAQRGVRATFFCVGDRVGRHAEVVRRIAAEGHLVENHSHRHSPWTNLFSVRRLRDEVSRAQSEIERATGRAPRFFRPPMGLTNLRVFRVARELGLTVTGYSARGFDQRTASAERVVTRILKRVRPGAIVLLHDGGVPIDRLLAAVAMLIDKLEAEGYQCRRLDELIACEARR